MGVDGTSRVLAAEKLALGLGLDFKLNVDNVLFSKQTLDVTAARLKAKLNLRHTVAALALVLAVVEEDAVVVEGETVWAKVGVWAVDGVAAQRFTFSKIFHSTDGVNDVVFMSLTSLILKRAGPRWESGKSQGVRGCCSHPNSPGVSPLNQADQEKAKSTPRLLIVLTYWWQWCVLVLFGRIVCKCIKRKR